MTDKQIIIDDVDISKCEYRSKLLEGVCTFYRRCANTFCPYKAKWLKEQLKRKEQECEELKAKIEYIFSGASPNFDYFCDICVAKDSCNQNCCFEQIKELIYEVE